MKKILFILPLILSVFKTQSQCVNPAFNASLWATYTTGVVVSYNPGGGSKDYVVKSGYSGCWNAPTLDGGSCWVLQSDPCAAPGTPPTIGTTSPTSIIDISASSGGNITDEGSSAVTARGVCWSTSSNPTISDSKTTDGSGTGTFVSDITGLSPETKYYIRSYATNSEETGYGTEKWFYTGKAPTMTTLTAIDIHCESFTSGAESITFGRNKRSFGGTDALGSLYTSATQFGVIYGISESDVNNSTPSSLVGSTQKEVHLADDANSLNQLQRYVEITGLTPNTTYWYKSYTTNGLTSGYGSTKTFNTTTACPVYYSCPWSASQADRWSLNSDCSTSDGASITSNSILYHRHDWLTSEITDLDSDVASEVGLREMTSLPYRLILQDGSRVVMDNPTFVGGFQLDVKDNAQFANNGSLLFHIDGTGGADGHVARLSNSGSILVRGSYDNRISLTGIGEFCKTGTFTNLNSIPSDLNGDKGNPPSMPHTRYVNGDCVGTSTLPIELIDFSVTKKDGKIYYEWITAAEINNHYFEIQVSVDGITWEVIKTIDGAGNSNEILYYNYNSESNDYIKYVRLKQVDFDGLYSYSNVKVLYDNGELNIYPNQRGFSISSNSESNVYIFSINGNLVNNIIIPSGYHEIRLDNYSSGIYFIRINDKSFKIHLK